MKNIIIGLKKHRKYITPTEINEKYKLEMISNVIHKNIWEIWFICVWK